MAITVTINKYVEGFNAVPSTSGGNGTDLLGTETWNGTTPITYEGRAIQDSEGNIKTFTPSLTTSTTKVGTRYLNTVYWKEENTAGLSEVTDNWKYEGTNNIIINLYYGKTQNSTEYKPSDDELGPTTPETPEIPYAPWSFSVEYYIDGEKTTFFQDVLSEENYPTSFDNIEKVLRVENYGGTIGVIIEYKKDGATSNDDFAIKAPSYVDSEGNTIYNLKYSSIGGAVIGTEYNYLNKFSTLKIYFTTDTSLTYNVNISANPTTGGTVSKSPSKTSYNYADKVTVSATQNVGYTFKNWSFSNLSVNTTTSSSYTFYVTNNHNCVANFTPNKYTITYKDQGGGNLTGVLPSGYPTTHTYGTITTLKNPTKAGYTFGGWFTNSACTGTALKSLSATGYTANIILYAKWTIIEYTITYTNLNGATNPTSNPSKYTIETPTITFTAPTNNIPKGYTWSKWNPSSITKGSTGNKTITAEWLTNKYTLTWDLKGGTVTQEGTCAPLNSTGDSNGLVYGQVEYLSNITAPIVSKNGYTFEGWSVNGVDVITPTTTMPDGNVKYVAVYSTKTYTITVNANTEELLDKVYILKGDDENTKYTTTTCTTGDKITLVAENTVEYVLSHWQKSGKGVVSGQNEFTFTANDTYLDSSIENNIFTAYYEQDPSATLKINFIVDDIIEKTAIFKFNTTFSYARKNNTEGSKEYMFEIQGEPECIEGDIEITQEGYIFIPIKYNEKDICMVPNEQDSGTTELICSNKGTTIAYDGSGSQYYADNTAHNSYCPFGFEWQAYLPTNIADETHLVFPAAEKEENSVLYGPLVIDVYYGEIPERFLPVVPEDIEITTVSGLTLLQRIQNKIATFKWLNNLFGEPEKTSWDSYDNSGLKSFLKDDSKETPLSMHCIEYGDLQIYNQDMDDENINGDKTIKQYSFTSDATIIKPLNGQVVLEVSKIEGNKIYFNITNLSGFANTDNGIYIYFSVNSEIEENNATLYKMKLPKSPSNKGLLLTIPEISNIETLYIYRAPIMVDSTNVGITPKILFNYEKVDLPITVYDETTLNVVI